MNILFISNASGYGGSERTLEIIVNQLSKKNSVTVYAENEIHIENLGRNNVNIIRSRKGKKITGILQDLFLLRKKIQEVDAVITNTNKAAFYLSILSFVINKNQIKKSMIFVRDFQWKYCGFIFWALKNSRFYVASPAVIDFVAQFGITPSVIPNPVELSTEVSSENQLCKLHPVIICPAMISRWKGLEYLIRAVKKINKKSTLYIIGKKVDEDYYNFLKKEAGKIENGSTVHFIEYTHEIKEYYKMATVVVNSSISKFGGPETFGRTIIEAWSYKKPAIAFSCGGPKYLIDNYKNGILVEEENVAELTSALNDLLDNDILSSSLGENGYKKVQNEFSSLLIAEKIIKEIQLNIISN